jgi:3-hydroxyacyl-[acyl-carrier-protein] dehydratase
MTQTLIPDFYQLNDMSDLLTDDTFTARIGLNPHHILYQGHFPSGAIVPGVMIMQIIKELLQKRISQNLMLTQGDNVKFLAPLLPTEQNSVHFHFTLKRTDAEITASVTCFHGDLTYAKFKGTFKSA